MAKRSTTILSNSKKTASKPSPMNLKKITKVNASIKSQSNCNLLSMNFLLQTQAGNRLNISKTDPNCSKQNNLNSRETQDSLKRTSLNLSKALDKAKTIEKYF